MKPTQNNNKKLSLVKERIATLSGNQMESIVAGGTIGGQTKSTVNNFTCTACTYTSNQTDAGCATK